MEKCFSGPKPRPSLGGADIVNVINDPGGCMKGSACAAGKGVSCDEGQKIVTTDGATEHVEGCIGRASRVG